MVFLLGVFMCLGKHWRYAMCTQLANVGDVMTLLKIIQLGLFNRYYCPLFNVRSLEVLRGRAQKLLLTTRPVLFDGANCPSVARQHETIARGGRTTENVGANEACAVRRRLPDSPVALSIAEG